MTIRTISETDGIAFITNKELIGLNKDGRPCEICDIAMVQHEWVLLDPIGFCVGVCSISAKEILKKEKDQKAKEEYNGPDVIS